MENLLEKKLKEVILSYGDNDKYKKSGKHLLMVTHVMP